MANLHHAFQFEPVGGLFGAEVVADEPFDFAPFLCQKGGFNSEVQLL